MQPPPELGTDRVTTLLCDADGCLFPSEEPAFAASAGVTNEFLRRLGSVRQYDAGELQAIALGRNFRRLAREFGAQHGVAVSDAELEEWVRAEQLAVTRHLAQVLVGDPAVRDPLVGLSRALALAVVSSSALGRLEACFAATGLSDLFPPAVRFSAQDSLPTPTSKPDPAVYLAALDALHITADEAVAVEDAVAGVRSAVGAGVRTVGNLTFVPQPERASRARELTAAGAVALVDDWTALSALLGGPVTTTLLA